MRSRGSLGVRVPTCQLAVQSGSLPRWECHGSGVTACLPCRKGACACGCGEAPPALLRPLQAVGRSAGGMVVTAKGVSDDVCVRQPQPAASPGGLAIVSSPCLPLPSVSQLPIAPFRKKRNGRHTYYRKCWVRQQQEAGWVRQDPRDGCGKFWCQGNRHIC